MGFMGLRREKIGKVFEEEGFDFGLAGGLGVGTEVAE